MVDCAWCRRSVPATARRDSRFCSKGCRQFAFRLRRRASTSAAAGDASPLNRPATGPLRFAYADPPYPGTAKKYYGDQSDYAGEVDHASLVAGLVRGGYAGWALSTSARSLGDILPLCPKEVRVCAWVKPGGAPPATFGLHGLWEPLIVLQGRRLRPGRPDRLVAHAARGGGTLPGRKPVAFCGWLFECLGMLPGDELVDLYPGTGIVTSSWNEISRGSARDASCSSKERRVALAGAPAPDDVSSRTSATVHGGGFRSTLVG